MSQSQQRAPKVTNDDSSRLQYRGSHPHPYLGDYYHHYYPPPPYHPSAYIGPPPPSDKQTSNNGTALRAFYSHQQYDVDAFTPHPPKSSRSRRATPPTITPHDWIPEGISTPKMSPYFETPEPPALTGSASSESTGSQDRPVPARSAFMCFMQARRGENTNEAAEEWRLVSKEERAHWENVASKDRKRYNKERKDFEPSARKVRRKKDPSAPKRPMSAFLMFAQTKRSLLQKENPDIPNADISRMLGEIWCKAGVDEKRPFLEREESERKLYKAKMERFKCDQKLAKSLAPTLNNPTTAPVFFDQRQDDEELLAHRAEESAGRYAPPPNINEFGAAYPVEAAYHYRPYGGLHCGDRQPVLTPVQEERSRSSKYWEGSSNPIDSGIKYSYPRPDDGED